MLHSAWPSSRAGYQDRLLSHVESGKVTEFPRHVHTGKGFSQVSNSVFSDTLGGMRKTLAIIALLASIGGLSACAGGPQTKDTTPVMSLTPVSKLIDVRTVEEFAEGHVQGAQNADVESGAFQEMIASLDKEASYSLYFRS